MPHKRNPIVSERMAGLARLLRGYAATALENVALWHERDISHSSAERVIFADACTVLHYMLVTFERVVAGLTVNEKRMRNNLEATGGLVYSQAALLALARAGMPRDSAYAIVQRHAMTVWESGGELEELLAADPEVILDRTELARCFQPERFLENAGVVFDRLEGLTLA
jgi:adenylosuccinate lyase